MTSTEIIIKEKLTRSLDVCEMHISRLRYAISSIEDIFPLNVKTFSELSELTIQSIDQFIYRFIKLQDELGNKTFRLLLEGLKEEIKGKPFIDILSRLEQLGVLECEEDWMKMREIRNELTHEYPHLMAESVNGLNHLYSQISIIFSVFDRVLRLAHKYNLIVGNE